MENNKDALKRTIGLWGLSANIINTVVICDVDYNHENNSFIGNYFVGILSLIYVGKKLLKNKFHSI